MTRFLIIALLSLVPFSVAALPQNFTLADTEKGTIRYLPEQTASFWMELIPSGGVGLIDYGPWYLEQLNSDDYTRDNFVADYIVQNPQLGVSLSNVRWEQLELDVAKSYWFPIPPSELEPSWVAAIEAGGEGQYLLRDLASMSAAPPAAAVTPWEFTEADWVEFQERVEVLSGLTAELAAQPGVTPEALKAANNKLRQELMAEQVSMADVESAIEDALGQTVSLSMFNTLQATVGGLQTTVEANTLAAKAAIEIASTARTGVASLQQRVEELEEQLQALREGPVSLAATPATPDPTAVALEDISEQLANIVPLLEETAAARSTAP